MSTYNVGWLKDNENQIFIPFTYAKSVKIDNTEGNTLDKTVTQVGQNVSALGQHSVRLDNLEKGTTAAGVAKKVEHALIIGRSDNKQYDGSAPITITAKDLGITGALVYRGISTSPITDGGTQEPTIEETKISLDDLDPGNIVLYKKSGENTIYQEFVWTGEHWELLGDEGSYALKTIEIGAGAGLSGGGTLSASFNINVETDGITVTIKDDKVSLAIMNITPTEEDINIDHQGITSITLPSVTVDEYGRVKSITNKTIKFDKIATEVINLRKDLTDAQTLLGEVVKDISADLSEDNKIVPRINQLERRTKFLNAESEEDTSFIIAGKEDKIGMKVDEKGVTSFDFVIANENEDISLKEELSKLHQEDSNIGISINTINNTTITAGDGLSGGGTIGNNDHNITLSINANRGLNIVNDNVGHINSITAGSVTGSSGDIAFGGAINIPQITYDAQGHITSASTTTINLPTDSNLQSGINAINNVKVVSGPGLVGEDQTIGNDKKQISLEVGAGTGIQVNADNVALKPLDNPTKGTFGSTSEELNATNTSFDIPRITIDEYGRATAVNQTIGISELTTNIKTNADKIATKAAQSDLNNAVARITQNEKDIATKAAQSDLNNTIQRVEQNEKDIDSLEKRVGNNETAIATNVSNINIIETNINGVEPEQIEGKNNPNYKDWNILPRTATIENRTKYMDASENSNFIVADDKGNVALRIEGSGASTIIRGTNFVTAKNNNIDTNASNISNIESALTTKADKATMINTGIGLSGGGSLSSNVTISLASISGLTSGSYGPNTHITAPQFNASFTVPQIKVDQYGRVIEAFNRAVKIPSISELETGIANLTTSVSSIISNYKQKQSAVSAPSASGNSIAFIDTISQDENGIINPTKKNIPVFTPGHVQYAQDGNGNYFQYEVPGQNGLVPSPYAYQSTYFLKGNGVWANPTASVETEIRNILNGNTVVPKAHTEKSLTIAEKTFNGSEDITIELKDLGLTGVLTLLGITTTLITDNGTEPPTINGSEISIDDLITGNVVLYQSDSEYNVYQEFVWINDKWQLLGDEGSYVLKNDYNTTIADAQNRIAKVENKVTHIHSTSSSEDNALEIADDKGNIALAIRKETGETIGIDFKTADGNSVNINASNIADIIDGDIPVGKVGKTLTFTDKNVSNKLTFDGSTEVTIPVFKGATNSSNGNFGLVPSPAANEHTKFLSGDGTWKTVVNSDEKVKQTFNNDDKNYPLLASSSETPNGADLGAYYDTDVTLNPSTGTITATRMKVTTGKFEGGLITDNDSIILSKNTNYFSEIPTNSTYASGELLFEEISNGQLVPTNGSAGQILTRGSTAGELIWADNKIPTAATSTRILVAGIPEGVTNTSSIYYNNEVFIEDNVLMGAAWNDYAEYRICKDNYKPGQVICENGDDTLSISIKRLQPGAEIISDTFGFAIGQTAEATCPVAISGRVLAYTYEPREEFKAGDPVCAGPNGTVSKMTREEVREYPDRMIGTVSAIPSYETWNDKVIVNNRIWIKIK